MNILPQDNYDTYLTAALGSGDTTIYVGALPAKTSGFLVIYDVDGRTIKEKIKYTGTASSPNSLTGCVRGLPFTDTAGVVSDAEVAANKMSHPKNVRIAMTDNVHYLARALSQLNGDEACGGIPKNPAARAISDVRHLVDKEYADALSVSALPAFLVTKNGADPTLTVNVGAGRYIKPDNTSAAYAGGAAVAVLASNTNYVEMDTSGTVTVNQSAFTAGSFPLATVVCSGTTITAINDKRCFLTQNDGTIDRIRTWATVQTIPANKLLINSDASAATEAVRLSLMRSDAQRGLASGTSGEAFAIGNALYVKASDGKLYMAQGTVDEKTYSFVGIAQEAATGADQTKLYARPGGIATGLTGLTAGAYYYITDTAGTLGTTPGTRTAKIGQALTTTTLRVCEPKFVRSGTQSFSSVTAAVQTCGFYPAYIIVKAAHDANGGGGTFYGLSIGDDTNTCVQMWGQASTNAGRALPKAWSIMDGTGAAKGQGTVTTKTQTGFTLNCDAYANTAGQDQIQWTAFSE